MFALKAIAKLHTWYAYLFCMFEIQTPTVIKDYNNWNWSTFIMPLNHRLQSVFFFANTRWSHWSIRHSPDQTSWGPAWLTYDFISYFCPLHQTSQTLAAHSFWVFWANILQDTATVHSCLDLVWHVVTEYCNIILPSPNNYLNVCFLGLYGCCYMLWLPFTSRLDSLQLLHIIWGVCAVEVKNRSHTHTHTQDDSINLRVTEKILSASLEEPTEGSQGRKMKTEESSSLLRAVAIYT